RRARLHDAALRQHQRPAHRRGRPQVPLAAGPAAGRSPGPERPRPLTCAAWCGAAFGPARVSRTPAVHHSPPLTNRGCAMGMFRKSLALAALLASGLCTSAALAQDLRLTGAEETPPNDSTAVGTGSIKIDADGNVSGTISTPTIQGKAAHIHTGAPG